MAYMRGDFYAWSDGVHLHINELEIPDKVFEELAVMYFLRMTEEEREQAIRRAYENHGGNFGCEGVAKYLGKPSGYDMVKEALENPEAESI